MDKRVWIQILESRSSREQALLGASVCFVVVYCRDWLVPLLENHIGSCSSTLLGMQRESRFGLTITRDA